jgi:mRNA interferase RelE/StbE
MSYQVIVPKPVQKQLDGLPDSVRERVIRRIAGLKEDPRPHGCVKLKGYENEYRIRIGDYRVRYEVRDQESIVLLLHCKHRKDVY